MHKWVKVGVFALGGVVLLAAGLVGAGLLMEGRRAARQVEVAVKPVAWRTDASAVERGAYLYASRGCADCHGEDGTGRTLVDDGQGTKLSGLNLTSGNPKMAAYREADWVRSIRHGVSPTGRPLRLMPSEDYNRLTDDDLAAVVAWIRQLPPKPGNLESTLRYPLPARVMYGFGMIPEAYERIDHRLPPAQPVPEAVSADWGRYVAQMCIGCHAEGFVGGRVPGGPPDWPAAPRLSPGEGSVMPRYAKAEAFLAMFKTGKRPDGSAIAVMPFGALSRMNETDTRALHAFLTSLPAR